MWAEAFEAATRVLYWPFALPDERIPTAGSWLQDALLDLSIGVHLDTWEHLGGHDVDELAGYDLLFVGGGTTSKLVTHLQENKFADAVRDFLAAGGTYYGGSAGALLACDEITLASHIEDDPQSAGMPGLGLVHGVSVFPHADKFPIHRPVEVARLLGHSVLVLPESSGVAVGDGTLRAIGPGTPQLVTQVGRSIQALRAGETVVLSELY